MEVGQAGHINIILVVSRAPHYKCQLPVRLCLLPSLLGHTLNQGNWTILSTIELQRHFLEEILFYMNSLDDAKYLTALSAFQYA